MKCAEVYSIQVRSLVKNTLWISVQLFCVQVTYWELLIGVVVNFYKSLVCIEVVLCLAIVSTALQKLRKCVMKNTRELRNMSPHWRLWPNYTSCPQVVATQVVAVAGQGRRWLSQGGGGIFGFDRGVGLHPAVSSAKKLIFWNSVFFLLVSIGDFKVIFQTLCIFLYHLVCCSFLLVCFKF